MNKGVAMLAAVAVGFLACLAMADRTSTTYTLADGGAVSVPPLVARKAVEFFNAETVAVCVVAGSSASPSAPCRPIIPGASMSIDASDSHGFSIRRCSGTTVASCLGDGGVVITEIQ